MVDYKISLERGVSLEKTKGDFGSGMNEGEKKRLKVIFQQF